MTDLEALCLITDSVLTTCVCYMRPPTGRKVRYIIDEYRSGSYVLSSGGMLVSYFWIWRRWYRTFQMSAKGDSFVDFLKAMITLLRQVVYESKNKKQMNHRANINSST